MNIGTHDITVNPILGPDDMHIGTPLVMASHSDTRRVNKHAFIESIVEGVRVHPLQFYKSIVKRSDLPIVITIYAYENPNTSCTIILKTNHVIYIKDMKHKLLFPNQAHEYGIIVDDTTPHSDHTVTDAFTITDGYYDLPLE